MQVSEFLVSVFQAIQIRTAFSLVGGMAMHINRATHDSGIRITYCNHEQAVVAATEGYVKADGFERPGLAIVTSGPGVTNTVTSLTSAFYDSVPMYLISGQVKTADINRFGVRSFGAQEVPHLDLLRPITKLSFQYDPQHVSLGQLAANLALAMTGRKGPVHIDVPLDVQSRDVMQPNDVDTVVRQYQKIIDADALGDVTVPTALITALQNARRPVCVLGNALKIAAVPHAQILELMDHLGIPCLFTWASMDLVDDDHPMNFGCAGGLAGVHSNTILQHADCIVFLGTRLDLLTTGYQPAAYGKNAERFVFECDPAERAKLAGMPKTTVVPADVRGAVRALLALARRPDGTAWVERCTQWRDENNIQEAQEFSEPRLNSFHVARLISAGAATRYVVPTASGFAIEGFARFYKTTRGSKFSWAGHVLGSMGLALPSAIGASVRTESCVACIDGDGGFLLNVQELYTLKANPHLGIAIFILNNRGYASIVNSQSRAFSAVFGADASSGLTTIQFEPLAHLADLHYVQCTTVAELQEVIAAIQPDSRMLIDVMLEDDGYRGPAISTKFDAQGRPYSTQLEDVAWR